MARQKDTTGRQLAGQLSQPGALKGASVTLGAVEYLLYEDLPGAALCPAPRISAELVASGGRLQQAWYHTAGYAQQLEQMQLQGGEAVVLTQILGQLAHRFDRIEKKLDLPLNTVDHPRPLFAEAWRSAQSLHFYAPACTACNRNTRPAGCELTLNNGMKPP
ncbi:hypothetical protein MBH78_04760 [Oceanimonas sp. NS1]|nr:hypothetical protein [Oceanimonas sp. NS1]